MRAQRLSFWVVATTLWMASTVSYLLCIAGDLLVGWTMYESWSPLLPGFQWPLTTAGFILGLIWLIAYSLYFAAVFVIPYNALITRQSSTSP